MKPIVAFGALLYWLSVSPRIRSLAMLCTGAALVTSIIVEVGDERSPTIYAASCLSRTLRHHEIRHQLFCETGPRSVHQLHSVKKKVLHHRLGRVVVQSSPPLTEELMLNFARKLSFSTQLLSTGTDSKLDIPSLFEYSTTIHSPVKSFPINIYTRLKYISYSTIGRC